MDRMLLKGVTWVVLVFMSWSLLPTTSLAQQPTATIMTVSGTVLVNGQEQGVGIVLQTGDLIETQAGASIVLKLSDGSVLEIGQNSQMNLADLSLTADNARVSRVQVLWGWMRAKLSQGHQQEGASFTIDTPNALIGVKFSQPDVEVNYDLSKQETIALAHTVQLIAKNLLTDEEVLVPVGSSVIIAGETIKIIAGILAISEESDAIAADVTSTDAAFATEAAAAKMGGDASAKKATETAANSTDVEAAEVAAGMSTGTKVAIGAGVLAAAGGVAAIAASSGGDDGVDNNNSSFTGTFRGEYSGLADDGQTSVHVVDTLSLSQNGNAITGTYTTVGTFGDCCTATITTPATGTVTSSTSAVLSWPAAEDICEGDDCSGGRLYTEGKTVNIELLDNGKILRSEGGGELSRQKGIDETSFNAAGGLRFDLIRQ